MVRRTRSCPGGQAGGEKQQGDAVLNATERRSTPEKASRPALTPSLAAKEKKRRAKEAAAKREAVVGLHAAANAAATKETAAEA